MNERRVVITGIGALSPLGLDIKTNWQGAVEGRSGIAEIKRFDTEGLSTKIAGLIDDFNPDLALTPKEQKKCDLFIQYGCEAARQAILDSGLELNEAMSMRAGTAFASGIGGLLWIEKNHDKMQDKSPRRVSPFFIPGSIINMVAGNISLKHQLKGPTISAVTACATGLHNIGMAARMVAYGDADIMLAGGVEVANSKLTIAGFASAKALSKRNDEPKKASRPFDKHRDGFVIAEGAGALVLEEYEHAKARGAHIYAELLGFGMSADAFHITLPDPNASGAIRSMQAALNDAQVSPSDIHYINAHGTSTKANDAMETQAIKQLFGSHAYKLAVSATKSMTGHLLGAAGALEAIFSVLSLKDQIAPPTINLDHPDEGLDLDYIPHTARHIPMTHVLCNSFGFGGANASLLFKRFT